MNTLSLITSIVIFSLASFVLIVTITDESYGISRNEILDFKNYKQQINKYVNYVHLQPDWNSYPLNMIFHVSTSWFKETNSDIQGSSLNGLGAKNHNYLQYVNGKSFIEVQYDYVDCRYQWIHYARVGAEILNHQWGFLMGFNKNPDYTSASITNIPNSLYSNDIQQTKLRDGFAQFIPICTSDDVTTFEYSVKTNDENMVFDVYFVPSLREKYDYFYASSLTGSYFDYYDDQQCYGQNFKSFGGKCENVSKHGGLLIIIPDELSKSVTQFSIKLKELE